MRTLFLATAIVLAAGHARAEPTAADKVLATQLFEDAERLSAARSFGDACPKYAESQRLDPQLGTLLHLADCNEKLGQTASAWAHFKEAAGIAARRGDNREATAKSRASALESKLSRLEIGVPTDAPAQLEIRQDGNTVGRAAWGTAVPIDPGEHTVVAKADGYKAWTTSFQIAAAGRVRIAIPKLELEAARPSATTPVEAPPIATSAQVDSPMVPAKAADGSGQRLAGYVIGGAGVVGLGVGAIFFAQRASKLSERDDIVCPMNRCSPQDGQRITDLTDEARSASTVGLVASIAGGGALLTGAILVLTAPSRSNATGVLRVLPWAGRDGAGASAFLNW